MRVVASVLLFALSGLVQVEAQESAKAPEPERAYFYFRVWPDSLAEYDIATDTVTRKLQSKHGISHGNELSHDRQRMFMITGKRSTVEVVDLATMTVVEEHSFEEPSHIIRVSQIMEQPGGEKWYVKIDRVKIDLDRYEILEPQWLTYQLADKKILERKKELPRPIRRGARIGPDGSQWHVFGRDLTVVDPATGKETGKIELSRPLYSGMGPLSVRGEDFFDGKNPKAYRMIYTMRDPVRTNRTLFGRLDLDLERMEVTNLQEWGASPRVWGWELTRDRRLGITQSGGRDRGQQENGDDPVLTLLTYDLTNGKKLRETRVDVRNGLSLRGISPDGQKLYLTGRGHELVVYDDQHQYLKTVELEGETDGSLITVYR